jgi:hypothetical protein
VRIGNALVSATSFSAPVIDRLSRRYPRIVFHVVPAGPDILHRELNARSKQGIGNVVGSEKLKAEGAAQELKGGTQRTKPPTQ